MDYQTILNVHIAVGAVGSLAGLFVLLATRKGSRRHVAAGRIFLVGMGLASLSTFVLVALKPSLFLALIAVFTLYLMSSGVSAITRHQPVRRLGTALSPLAAATIAGGMGWIAWQGWQSSALAIPAAIFTTWAVVFLSLDVVFLSRRSVTELDRVRRHLFRMLMSLGFAFGAVSVNNAARIGMNTTTLPAIVNAVFCTIIAGYAIWVTVAWRRAPAAIQ